MKGLLFAVALSFVVDGIPCTDMDLLGQSGKPVEVLVNGNAVANIPGPRGLPLIGSHCEVYPDHLGNHERLFQSYGPIFKTTVMGRTVYHTNDPEITAHVFKETAFFTKEINSAHPLYGVKSPHAGVFLTDTHTNVWKEAHKFMVPAFGPRAIEKYGKIVATIVRKSFHVFDKMEDDGLAWNSFEYTLKLTSQIMGTLVVGVDFGHLERVDSPIHDTVAAIFRLLGLNKKVTSWGDWYSWLPFGDPKRLRDTWHEVGSRVGKHVADASKGSGDLPLQQAAVEAKNLAGLSRSHDWWLYTNLVMLDYLQRGTDMNGNKMAVESSRPALIVALTAGFVTTSALLSWLLFGLATYDGCQSEILQELIENGMTEETEMTGEFIGRLSFLDKFVKETQRHHTTSFQPARTARVDLILPSGHRLPKGAVVIPEVHHIHHNDRIWENPTRFDPYRWDTEQVKSRHRAAYIPFAMGPRMCIAMNLVLSEVKIILAQLVYRYEFVRYGNEAIEYDPMFQTIRPRNLYIKTIKRTTWDKQPKKAS